MRSKATKTIKLSTFFLLFLFIFFIYLKASIPDLYLSIMNNFGQAALEPPHGGCSSCHILHDSPGAQLGLVDGNANLCMSCHNPVGAAHLKPFTNADKAEPGVGGTSHAWNIPAVNAAHGANLPSNFEMARRVMNDTIVCSTCHDQHSQTYSPFLRATNAGDSMCKDCHSVRDVGIYSTAPLVNKGSHPVGVVYDGMDTRFEASPIDTNILLIGTNVECSSCHKLHYANTTDGYILRATNDDNLCQSCHTYGPHQGMGCSVCHQPHNNNLTNIYLVKDTIQTPNSGLRQALFTAETGTNSFADGNVTYDGVCEVCHTATAYHQNNSSGDHSHNVGLNCTSCHPHANAFEVNCTACHGFPPDGMAGPNLDGSHTTHFTAAYGPQLSLCEDCHLFSGVTHMNGVVNFADNQLLANTTVCDNCHSPGGNYDGVNNPDYGAKNNWVNGVYTGGKLMAGKENWCAGCHDSAPASSKPDGTGVFAPDVAGDGATYGYYYSGHGKNLMVKCTNCHDPGAGHIDTLSRTYAYDQSIANLEGTEYRIGYRLSLVNGLEPMRIPLNNTPIAQSDTSNFRMCVKCHNWNNLSDTISPYASNFNHSGTNAIYSYGYDLDTSINNHVVNHLDMQTHYGPQPFWDSDWDFTTTADPVPSVAEINGYDSFITCVTCHDVHGGQAFGGNTEGNMMRDGRLQDREPGLKFTYLVEAAGGFPMVTSVGANKENSVGGVIRGGVDYRAGYDGTEPDAICGGCHGESFPATDEYNASGTAGNSCMECHMMSAPQNYFIDYFRTPTTGCILCHSTPQDNGDGVPAGGRRQIVGTDGDFIRTSHHADGVANEDCELCHYTFNHMDGTVQLKDPDQGDLLVYDFDPGNKVGVEGFCLNCHDTDGVNGDVTPFTDNVTVPVIDNTLWTVASHKTSPFTCLDCHDNGHGSNKNKLLEPFDKIADASADPMDDEEEFCENCHSTAGIASTDIEAEFNRTHTHQVDEVSQQGNISGLECVSCHNPHQNTAANPLSDPDDNNILWTQTTNGDRDFCLRCHDGAPPTGITFPATSYGTGWDKSGFVGSRHDQVINSGETNYVGTVEDCRACHEHHGADGTANNTFTGIYTMLKGSYDKSGTPGSNNCNPWSSPDYGLCFTCHNTSMITTTSNTTSFEDLHEKHVISQESPCILCHDVHSSYDAGERGLINLVYGAGSKSSNDINLMSATQSSAFYFSGPVGSCYLSCHDNSGPWNCGNEFHNPRDYNGNPISYPWSYTWPK